MLANESRQCASQERSGLPPIAFAKSKGVAAQLEKHAVFVAMMTTQGGAALRHQCGLVIEMTCHGPTEAGEVKGKRDSFAGHRLEPKLRQCGMLAIDNVVPEDVTPTD